MDYAAQSFDWSSIGSSKITVGSTNTKFVFSAQSSTVEEEPDYSKGTATSNEIEDTKIEDSYSLEKWQYKGTIKLAAESFAITGTFLDEMLKVDYGENSKLKSVAATFKFTSFLLRGKLTGDIEGELSGVLTAGKDAAKQLFNDKVTKGLTDTLKNMVKIPAKGSTEEAIKKVFTDIIGKNGSSVVVKNITATAGVNIVANVVFKLGEDIYKYGPVEGTKKFIKEDAADQIFKGTVTTIFSVAGNIFGALPGGTAIKMACSVAGVAVSEWAVEQFETEWGLLAASGAMVAGAIAGYAAGAAIASAFLVSNPIGWTIALVGGCLLVGAAVGAVIVWAVEKVIVYWDEICEYGAKVLNACYNFVIESAEAVVEYIEEKVEEFVEEVKEAVSVVVEEVEEGWNDFKRGCKAAWNWLFG